IEGGLPSFPHGVWLNDEFLGAVFSNVPVKTGDRFTRPSAGGGGFGDPLARDVDDVCDDVADGYVTVERALKDYGVVVRAVDPELAEFEVDREATERERSAIREARRGWIEEHAEAVAERYRAGEIDVFDAIRRYGVILDWGSGELLQRTTEQFRAMLARRAVRHW
ncbi:MAG TPA: hydantoinase B/oxoprolinase family protein, partial [Solirubrobacteraceae bacterium]|nr:hydantoinase B/oxoprolinase family protein [Solirubrobacteraceae bacterium]